jgi:hypothetical protein
LTDSDLLALLPELEPAEAAERLLSLAREQGIKALATLRQALEMPELLSAAIGALGEIPNQEAWDLLEQLSREKGRGPGRKLARRAQHRLRSRGFHPTSASPKPTAPKVELAQSSFFDIEGNQFMRLVVRAPLDMLRYAGFIVSSEGLRQCLYVVAGRPDVEEMLAAQDVRFGEDLVEVGLAHIAARVRQAAETSRERASSLPEDYFDAIQLFENAPEDSLPEELAADAATAEPVSPAEATTLIAHRTMWGFLPHPEQLAPYAQDWLRVFEHQAPRLDEGVANLGVVQARGQLADRVIRDLYDESSCRRLQEQLEEQGRLLFALREKGLAAVAVRCAASLDADPETGNVFLRALVHQGMELSVRVLREQEEEARQGPWTRSESEAGPLWVPRPAQDAEEEDEPTPRLWLPGQE